MQVLFTCIYHDLHSGKQGILSSAHSMVEEVGGHKTVQLAVDVAQ